MKHRALFLISSLAISAMLVSPAFSQKFLGYTVLGSPTMQGQIYSAADFVTNKIYVSDTTAPGVLTVVSGATRSILTTITVGAGGSQAVADPATGIVYAFSGQAQTISVIQESTDTVISTIPPVVSDDCLTGIAIDTGANQLAVLDPCSKLAYVLDGSSYTLLSTVSVPLNTMVDYKVNPVTHLLYVVDSVDHEYVVANLTTSTSITINLSTFWPQSVAIDYILNRVYMADNVLSSLYIFDGATSVLLETIKPPTDPYSVGVNATNHEVSVSDGYENMYFYYPFTLTLNGQITFPSPLSILAFSVNSATNDYYVGAFPANALAFIRGPK
jgi:DNA-binding beta-propeller fold protein YncE